MSSIMKGTQMQCETTTKEKSYVKKSKTLSDSAVCKFVGHVDNLWKIVSHHLWGNKFRINAWTETRKDGMFCSFHKIEKSYFVELVDGKIVDLTVPQKPKKEKIF